MRRVKLINKNMNPKTKARIRNTLTALCVLLVVILFIALVVGLSLGLRDDDDDCPGAKSKLCGDECKDIHTDENNCGGCGDKCKTGALCIDGSCDNCAANCTTDANMCTIEPCDDETGCTLVDCETDEDQCTTAPCDSETGCTPVDCDNDDDACSTAPCDSETGCARIDCNGDDDPCTSEPCSSSTGCTNICPVLMLDSSSSNFTAQYPNFNTARRIVGTGLTLTSMYNIQTVEVTVTPSGSGGDFSITPVSGSGITGALSGDTYTLTGPATPAQFQTTLRTLRYTNSGFSGSRATFTFALTNVETTDSPSNVYSVISLS